jgi:hypothetical protein
VEDMQHRNSAHAPVSTTCVQRTVRYSVAWIRAARG